MHRLQAVASAAAALFALCAGTAQAGIIFTPHLSEYSRLPAGQYTELTLIGTEIEHIYDRDGNKVQLGVPFVPPGDSTDAMLALIKYLWIGNVFRDTGIPYLERNPQFCRIIGVAGYQQNTGVIANRVRLFGHRPGANGLGDMFGLCGIYGDEHRWGPVKANGLFATTVKFPIGQYDTDAALNIGTNYWSVIPQFAWHAEFFGRFIMDGTVAYQWNGDNDSPSFGGLTPTRPADVWNAEVNLAFKFSEHWFVDVGFSHRESVGSNHYDKLTVNFKDQPLSPESACANTNNGLAPTLGMLGINDPLVTPEICNNPALDQFYLRPRPGPYADRGIEGDIITAGIYYIYRTSSVLQLRVAKPIAGRGGEIDAVFDVCSQPCGGPGGSPVATVGSRLYGVQEAAAVSASPYVELRFVYLFWAP